MALQGVERRLAAILAADVVAYSRLMEADEEGTHARLKAHRDEFIDLTVAGHNGRIVKLTGDGVLVEFPSAVQAVQCAVEIQRGMAARNANVSESQRIIFRIGVNLGDVIIEDDDIYGGGVNVAARLEALADPGGILISGTTYDQVEGKLDRGLEFLGEKEVKNIERPVRVYKVLLDQPATGRAVVRKLSRMARWKWAAAATLALVIAAGIVGWLQPWTSPEEVASAQTEPLDLPSKPSIAVLPFDNLSGNPDQTYFSNGITEDVISALGRFSNLTVMSWNAVAPYVDAETAPAELRRALGVRYVVSGSVRRANERVRVTVQLIDAAGGSVLWSERYDESSDDIFVLQDEITHQLVSALAVRVVGVETERAASETTDNLAAYDLMLRGREKLRLRTRSMNLEARRLFERAITLDPEYASAYVGLAQTHRNDFFFGWSEWPRKSLEKVNGLAERALELDQYNARAHSLLGSAYGHLGRKDLAEAELYRARELNPNDPEVYANLGNFFVWAGRPRDAIDPLETARRFDPTIDPGWADLGTAYFLDGRTKDAIRVLEQGLSRHPDRTFAHIILTAVYADAGQVNDAKRSAENVRRLHPFFDVESFSQLPPFEASQDRRRVAEALRAAGLSGPPQSVLPRTFQFSSAVTIRGSGSRVKASWPDLL